MKAAINVMLHPAQEFRRLSSSMVAARDRAELFSGNTGAGGAAVTVREQ